MPEVPMTSEADDRMKEFLERTLPERVKELRSHLYEKAAALAQAEGSPDVRATHVERAFKSLSAADLEVFQPAAVQARTRGPGVATILRWLFLGLTTLCFVLALVGLYLWLWQAESILVLVAPAFFALVAGAAALVTALVAPRRT